MSRALELFAGALCLVFGAWALWFLGGSLTELGEMTVYWPIVAFYSCVGVIMAAGFMLAGLVLVLGLDI